MAGAALLLLINMDYEVRFETGCLAGEFDPRAMGRKRAGSVRLFLDGRQRDARRGCCGGARRWAGREEEALVFPS